MSTNLCSICSDFRELPDHIFELSEFCKVLDNVSEYTKDGIVRKVKTKNISNWLRLAAELEIVKINSWRFGNIESAMFCEPVADEYDSDSKHYTDFSTPLTRFVFICNALEEVYKFVDCYYTSIGGASKKNFREPSMRAASLVDRISVDDRPIHFEHLMENFTANFNYYKNKYNPTLSGINDESSKKYSYGLHLVRNIRNFIAHGAFPLLDNPEYWGEEVMQKRLINLLLLASRAACFYIQILLFKYNHGFQSDLYNYFMSSFDGGEYFLANCNGELLLTLHTKSTFSFQDPEGYYINNEI